MIMKFWLGVLVFISVLISVGMNKKEELGERIASNLYKLRAPQSAYAVSDHKNSDLQFTISVDLHIANLRKNKHLCEEAKRFLEVSYTTYKGTNIFDQEFNDEFSKRSEEMCF